MIEGPIEDLIYLLAIVVGCCLLLALSGWLTEKYYLWCLSHDEKHEPRHLRQEPHRKPDKLPEPVAVRKCVICPKEVVQDGWL